jgi:hypothetical protein
MKFVFGIVLLASMSGCGGIGAIVYKTAGPPPIPARYAPPKDQPLLVMVESSQPMSGSVPECDELAMVLHEELKAQQVAPMIGIDELHILRDSNPAAFRKMTIAQIGRQLGAKQIIYVTLKEITFESPPGSDVMRGKIEAKVKVINVDTADTVFPGDAETETYEHTSRYQAMRGGLTAAAIRRQIIQGSGIELSRWFYAYSPETMSEENADVRLR